MAAEEIVADTIIRGAGLLSAPQAAHADGGYFTNTGVEFVHVINASGSACEVTFATPRTVDGLDVESLVVDVAAGTDHFIGPFPTSTFNDSSNYVQMTYESETSLTLEVLKT